MHVTSQLRIEAFLRDGNLMTAIGRERELALISENLPPGSILGLSGPSGIGKTTLARQFIDSVLERTLVLDCFGMDPRDVAVAMTLALKAGSSQARPADLWLRLSEALEEGAVKVILLDDLSFPVEELRPLFAHWNGAILLTSILALGDRVIPVAPLEDRALEVFLNAARVEDLTFRIGPDNDHCVQEILGEVQGHPLGLCLAGRYAAISSPGNVLRALRDAASLTDQSRPERHRSIWRAASFTWNQFSTDQQSVLYAMALFERPVRITSLPVALGSSLENVVESVRELVRAGVVRRGEFQRPLQLFAEFARDVFPRENEAFAHRVKGNIVAEAARLAEAVPTGLHYTPEFTEEPSFWRFVMESEGTTIAPERLAPILSAWLRFMGVRDRA